MIRTRNCLTCKAQFSYTIGKGNDRKHCSTTCRQAHRLTLRATAKANAGPCITAGCTNKAQYTEGVCNTCYYRRRRTGTTTPSTFVPKYRYVDGAGYISLLRPDHPIAHADGTIREHRVILYEAIGPGVHPCYWCGKQVAWDTDRDNAQRLVVDHLNENKQDNTRQNLVPACNDCNRARGAVLPFLAELSDQSFASFIAAATEYRESLKRTMEPPLIETVLGPVTIATKLRLSPQVREMLLDRRIG